MMAGMTDFPQYELYKNSGVEWLGEIPDQWNLKKIKYLLDEVNIRSTTGTETLLSLSKYHGVVRKEELEERSGGAATHIGYKRVFVNDLVLNKMQAVNGLLAISTVSGLTSPDYSVYRCKDKSIVDIRYLGYLLIQPEYLGEFKRRVTGVMEGFIRLYTDDLYSIPSILPDIHTQKSIVRFLNQKTAQIDQAIAIKEQQIQLLQERKQIIIQQAVTQGLNPDVPMKDSGVDWIGQIPEHWKVKALKYIAFMKSGETLSPEQFIDDVNGYPAFGGNGLRGYTKTYTNNGEHILIGRQGALCGNVNYARGKFYASEHAIVVYPLNNEKTKWLGETIRTADFNKLSQSAAQPGIAVNIIKNVLFPYPPANEQDDISKYVNKKSTEVTEAIDKIKTQVELLKEYKTTLINSAVTGKIKITPEMLEA